MIARVETNLFRTYAGVTETSSDRFVLGYHLNMNAVSVTDPPKQKKEMIMMAMWYGPELLSAPSCGKPSVHKSSIGIRQNLQHYLGNPILIQLIHPFNIQDDLQLFQYIIWSCPQTRHLDEDKKNPENQRQPSKSKEKRRWDQEDHEVQYGPPRLYITLHQSKQHVQFVCHQLDWP